MADEQEAVANFLAITGSDETTAHGMLEATGYNLEQAVNLFFAAEAGQGAPAKPVDDEALARQLQE